MDWALEVVAVPVADWTRPLLENGVAAGDVNVIDDRDGGTMFDFGDPDGNAWVVQQIGARAGAPLLPHWIP